MDKATIWDEIVTGLSKVWTWGLYILLGIMGKFSYDALSGRKMSFLLSLAIAGLSVFVGIIVALICIQYEMVKAGAIIVPIATLLSEKLVVALYAYDWKTFVADVLGWWKDRLGKK